MKQLLILDSDPASRIQLRESFRERGYTVRDHATLPAWDEHEVFQPSHALIDLRLKGICGLDALVTLKRRYPACLSIILTSEGNIATAVQAMKWGAIDYLCKPLGIDEIENAFHAALVPALAPRQRPGLYEHERGYIEKILQDMDGNISRAARVLGIHRQSLQRKLRKFAD